MPSLDASAAGHRARLLKRRGVVPDRADAETPPKRFLDHPGQMQAWDSTRRIVGVVKGWQGGGTAIGAPWLLREIQRTADPEQPENDYMLITPDFSLLDKKALPEFQKVFEHNSDKSSGFGNYIGYRQMFEFSSVGLMRLFGEDIGPVRVLMAHAQKPESVEASTIAGLWGDEPGQFSDAIWEAINARCSSRRARMLLTSRPYEHNWFKTQIWDKREDDPDIEVVSFPSIMNPAFSREEWDRQKRILPPWKFEMKYGGVFTRPGGAVFDCIGEDDYEDPFDVPADWERVYGVDFGQVHTAVACFAKDPVKKDLDGLPLWHMYRTYFPKVSRATWQHVQVLKQAEPQGVAWPVLAYGGAPAEDEWRREWTNAGLPVMRPRKKDLMAGIEAVYTAFQRKRVKVFRTLRDAIVQFESYSWELDEQGEPVPGKIADKSTFHLVDAPRYAIVSAIDGSIGSCSSRYQKAGPSDLDRLTVTA